jgi:hypothetical protein
MLRDMAEKNESFHSNSNKAAWLIHKAYW